MYVPKALSDTTTPLPFHIPKPQQPSTTQLSTTTQHNQLAWLLLWSVAAYGWGIARSAPYIKIGDVVFSDPDRSCMQDLCACLLFFNNQKTHVFTIIKHQTSAAG